MADSNVREITGEDLELIEAEFVNIKHSTVRAIEGGHVDVQQVGALSIDGERVEITQSASAVIHGVDVYLNQGVSVITACNNANINYSFSPVSLSRGITNVNRSAVGIIGAMDVKAENTTSILMIANKVEGDVTTLLDWRSALAIGAVIGGAIGLLSIFRRR